jgi:N-acetyl-anhydromuramyl-L-alanine amidase AmpD
MADDWMPGVRKVETAATSSRGLNPEAVVCHVIQGARRTMDAWAAERPVVNQASYHFVIDTDGTPTQYVPISQRAWHAGRVPDPSLVAYVWDGFKNGVNPNDYTVGIGAEGMSGTAWNDEQHASCVTILNWLEREWRITIDEDTLIGHNILDPVSRAHDPGPTFDPTWLFDHMVTPLEGDNKQASPLRPFPDDAQAWAEAWSRGAEPVRTDGADRVYEIRVKGANE